MTSADFLAHRKRIYSKTSLGKANILVSMPATSTISVQSPFRALDFGSMWYLIRPNSLSVRQYRHRSLAYFSPNFTVSNDFVHANKVPLTWLPGTTPALTGLSPFGTLNFMNYIHHSRRTHCIKIIAVLVLKSESVSLYKVL